MPRRQFLAMVLGGLLLISAGLVLALLGLWGQRGGAASSTSPPPVVRAKETPSPTATPTATPRPTAPPERKRRPATDFELPTLDGGTLALSDLRGQAVLLNFWASWCGPCRVEMPILQRLYEEHSQHGFTVIAVNVEEPPETVAAYAEELRLTFPVLLDRSGRVVRLYRVLGLPTSYFVASDGTIAGSQLGALPEAELKRRVERLIELSTGQ